MRTPHRELTKLETLYASINGLEKVRLTVKREESKL